METGTPPPAARRRRRIAGERPSRPVSAAPPHSRLDTGRADGARAARRTPTGRWGSRTSLVILAVLLVALLSLVPLLLQGRLGGDSLDRIDKVNAVERSARTAGPAAEAAAAAILAYDYRSIDADEATALRFMTEDFAAEYTDNFDSVIRPSVERNRVRVAVSVLDSGVMTATEDTARVLLFLDQRSASPRFEHTRLDTRRIEMSLVRDGDSWLVDDISSY